MQIKNNNIYISIIGTVFSSILSQKPTGRRVAPSVGAALDALDVRLQSLCRGCTILNQESQIPLVRHSFYTLDFTNILGTDVTRSTRTKTETLLLDVLTTILSSVVSTY